MSGGLIFVIVLSVLIYIFCAETWGWYWLSIHEEEYALEEGSLEDMIATLGIAFPFFGLSLLLWLFIYLPMKINGLK